MPDRDDLEKKQDDYYQQLLTEKVDSFDLQQVDTELHKFTVLTLHSKNQEIKDLRKHINRLTAGLIFTIIVAGICFGGFTYYLSAYRVVSSQSQIEKVPK